MLCRRALSRLTAQAPKRPTTDVTHLAQRFESLHFCNGTARVPTYSRSFATRDRPVGRPKKGGAVTAKASTRRTTKKTTTTATAAKAAPKKKTTAPKKKAAPKKKKVLTEEQKARAERKKHISEIKDLKAAALLSAEPKKKPITAWTVFNSESVAKELSTHTGGSKGALGAIAKENGVRYKALTPAEREHYNHVANENKASNDAAYKSWVESHSAEAIKTANAARRKLKNTLLKDGTLKKGSGSYTPIKDERQVKRPVNSYNFFFAERQRSGDFKDISVPETGKLVGSEWKALSSAEKKKYDDLYEEAFQKYRREFKQTYGFEAPINGSHAAAASLTV